jgi:hypothetical protein
MARSPGLSQWQQTVSSHMAHLSKPQATVLALWSFGMVLAQSCGMTSVAATLAPLVGRSDGTLRQQLREWCYEAPRKTGAKRGDKRQELDVTSCFLPLLRWVLAWWPPAERRLALAMDASTLGQRFTVLAISIMYRGCAIPIAWVVLPATSKGAWRPHWERLFTQIAAGVPDDWTVIVLADRGLYARWLYTQIQSLGWHPFLRINLGGNYRPVGAATFRPLTQAVRQDGRGWSGAVTCFSSQDAQLPCTLLARWDAGHTDPWLIVTDLPPEGADVAWYGLRPMIECGFKDTKRGGWHWEQTKMTDAGRATRLWLAIAVATLWVVSVGGLAEANEPASMLDALPPQHVAHHRGTRRSRPRLLSCFRRGVIVIVTSLIGDGGLPQSRFVPAPWPKKLDIHMFIPIQLGAHQKAA